MNQNSITKTYAPMFSLILPILDTLTLIACFYLAFYSVFATTQLNTHYQMALLIGLFACWVILPRAGLYQTWRGKSRITETVTISLALSVIFLLLISIAFFTKTSAHFSRLWLGTWFAASAGLIISYRFMLRTFIRHLRIKGFNLRHTIIIASGDVGLQSIYKIQAAESAGLSIKAIFVDEKEYAAYQQLLDSIGLKDKIFIYTQSAVSRFIDQHDVDQLWFALPFSSSESIQDLVSEFEHSTIDISLVPDIFSYRLLNQSVSEVAGLPVINLSTSPIQGKNFIIKTIEDKLLAGIILLIITPVMAIIACGVKLSSPGPILYKQKRLSWNGDAFFMYKFRSMPVNTESSTGAVWAKSGEQRATAFGQFLRKTSLDELPQFINVLKGEMSIVGPRPERPVFVDTFKHQVPGYMQKHKVKAGITGLAQVNGWRGDTDLHERIRHDLQYINSWSLWLDVKIIFLTIFKGFTDKNAY